MLCADCLRVLGGDSAECFHANSSSRSPVVVYVRGVEIPLFSARLSQLVMRITSLYEIGGTEKKVDKMRAFSEVEVV